MRASPLFLSATLLAGALLIAGCNAQAPGPSASSGGNAGASVAVNGMKLPEGAGCTGAIARYQAIIDNDHQTGNVEDVVYNAIMKELAPARKACAAGKSGEAEAIVESSKKQHGYPG